MDWLLDLCWRVARNCLTKNIISHYARGKSCAIQISSHFVNGFNGHWVWHSICCILIWRDETTLVHLVMMMVPFVYSSVSQSLIAGRTLGKNGQMDLPFLLKCFLSSPAAVFQIPPQLSSVSSSARTQFLFQSFPLLWILICPVLSSTPCSQHLSFLYIFPSDTEKFKSQLLNLLPYMFTD